MFYIYYTIGDMWSRDIEISKLIDDLSQYDSSLQQELTSRQYDIFKNLQSHIGSTSNITENIMLLQKKICEFKENELLWSLWHTDIDIYMEEIHKSVPAFEIHKLYSMITDVWSDRIRFDERCIEIDERLVSIKKHENMLESCIALLENEISNQNLFQTTVISYLLSLVRLYKLYIQQYINGYVSSKELAALNHADNVMRISITSMLPNTKFYSINTSKFSRYIFDWEFLNIPEQNISRLDYAYILYAYMKVAELTKYYSVSIKECFDMVINDDTAVSLWIFLEKSSNNAIELKRLVDQLPYVADSIYLPIQYEDKIEKYAQWLLSSFNEYSDLLLEYIERNNFYI